MNKQRIILTIAISLILVSAFIIAQTGTFNLERAKETKLRDLGFNKIKVVETKCSGTDTRCFNFSGDLNEKLVSINTKVCDNMKTKKVSYAYSKIVNGKPLNFKGTKLVKTGECNYRYLSEKEVNDIINKFIANRVDELIKNDTEVYKPTIYPDKIIID